MRKEAFACYLKLKTATVSIYIDFIILKELFVTFYKSSDCSRNTATSINTPKHEILLTKGYQEEKK